LFAPDFYRLQEPILERLYGAKTVFTRAAITPPKVNRCGWNLEHTWAKCVGAGSVRFWVPSAQ